MTPKIGTPQLDGDDQMNCKPQTGEEEMNCFRCERNLSAYLDDQLCAAERVELNTHLEACQTCRVEFESHQAAWEAAHQVASEAAPDGLWQGIEAQLETEPAQAGLEELTLMVKGLAAEVQDLRRTVDDLRRLIVRTVREGGDAPGREAEEIGVRANPFRPGRPRDASIRQLRHTS